MNEARAYNQSIYLMLSVPYMLVGSISFAFYRGYKKALRQAQAEALRKRAGDSNVQAFEA